MTVQLLAAVCGYLLGSIPFGLLLTRFAGLGDIRAIGSGNIGATNVLRTGNKAMAAATLLLDGGKGAVAVALFGGLVSPEAGMLAGMAAVLGHNFPLWLGFRGGKGVATTLGVMLVVAWPVGVAAILIWLAAAALFRISSLAAILALATSPMVAMLLAGPQQAVLAAALAMLGVARHRANILRLLKGEEPRIGRKKTA